MEENSDVQKEEVMEPGQKRGRCDSNDGDHNRRVRSKLGGEVNNGTTIHGEDRRIGGGGEKTEEKLRAVVKGGDNYNGVKSRVEIDGKLAMCEEKPGAEEVGRIGRVGGSDVGSGSTAGKKRGRKRRNLLTEGNDSGGDCAGCQGEEEGAVGSTLENQNGTPNKIGECASRKTRGIRLDYSKIFCELEDGMKRKRAVRVGGAGRGRREDICLVQTRKEEIRLSEESLVESGKMKDENEDLMERTTCHQCKRNDKGRVIRCELCKSKRYCLFCLRACLTV